ncbi:MAG: ABC transporter substrate-binding protein [Chloroflexi bacterium]|nr:ABC transporter substrate-binding protein [Chloroflexota bacterium]
MYPADGEVTCGSGGAAGEFNGTEYKGNLKSIAAPDAQTVVFTLCNPDVAFLQKVAFSPFAINDSAWIESHAADGTIKDTLNGTGPYKLDAWTKGTELTYSAFDNYWNDDYPLVPQAVLRFASESGARLQALQSGTVHGITLVGPNDFQTVADDATLQLSTPPAGENLNTLYIGFNHNMEPWDDVNVRKAVALAINRQRIVDNFYPTGSEVATHFTPCAIEFACEGDDWFASGGAAEIQEAKDLLATAGFPTGFATKIQYRNVFRGYLPQPPVVAQDLKEQLAAIGINATVEEQESGTFIGNANAGLLEGIFLLGWGADYPEVTNFLDFHFGAGATSAFGDPYPDIVAPLGEGNSNTDPAVREAAYEEANNQIQALVPMVPVAHGAFANAWQAGVEGAVISPISNEVLWAVAPPSGDQIVLMQNAEPIGLYCADETDGESLRACEQSMEGLYGYRPGTSELDPALATSCEPNDDGTVWTCTLREGVTFHDGSTFEAHDVIASYSAIWDAGHELHKGNTGAFEYWPGLWGDFLNAPPAS